MREATRTHHNCSSVDRGMLMRYRGGAIGHASTAAATSRFLRDRDTLDVQVGGGAEETSDEEEDEKMASSSEESESDDDAQQGEAMEEDSNTSDSDNESEQLNEELDFDYDWDDVEFTGEEDEELDPEDLGPEDGEEDEDAISDVTRRLDFLVFKETRMGATPI